MSNRLSLEQQVDLLRDTVKLNGAGLAGAIALHASGKGLPELGLVGAISFLLGILNVVRSFYGNRLFNRDKHQEVTEIRITMDVAASGMAFVFGAIVLTATVFLQGWGQS